MNFIAFLILGLIAGSIAKAILPGRQNGGWFSTLILGVIGAVVGGWIGSLLFGAKVDAFWDLGSWVLAIVGSIVVLAIFGAITGRKKA
ncbi:GlsB/YeaQ/YmgE family stress response membrane protein [Mycetocola spongiae]|uniref:GlsB/YeaQ/YmgE family stress response membrane protein n=1 Tax=Mycetocola spongiae TaxID=2859226 RepID=UPI001CF3BB3E|nr:GlsB/YeaQ/YmgE family stress response membrane protein [Mycetocola spongiae]UCR88471.1 GlsB/YeaQ/YmgE family stress response membrane protein [Mycetocola spongiae]